MIDYIIFGTFISALAFCLLGWFSTSVFIHAHIPIVKESQRGVTRTMLKIIRFLLSGCISAFIWWHIASFIRKFGPSLLTDMESISIAQNNALERMSHFGWMILAFFLLVIVSSAGGLVSNIIIPTIIMRIGGKIPFPPTKLKDKIAIYILMYLGTMGQFVCLALSPIVIIPLYLLIFGW